jgi:hypothetical protein
MAHIAVESQSKLSPNAEQTYYVGVAPNSPHCILLYNKITRKIIIRRSFRVVPLSTHLKESSNIYVSDVDNNTDKIILSNLPNIDDINQIPPDLIQPNVVELDYDHQFEHQDEFFLTNFDSNTENSYNQRSSSLDDDSQQILSQSDQNLEIAQGNIIVPLNESILVNTIPLKGDLRRNRSKINYFDHTNPFKYDSASDSDSDSDNSISDVSGYEGNILIAQSVIENFATETTPILQISENQILEIPTQINENTIIDCISDIDPISDIYNYLSSPIYDKTTHKNFENK